IRERTLGPYHADTIEALVSLGASVGFPGDHAKAAAICLEVINRCDRNGTNTKTRFMQIKELASHRIMQGDPAEAERLMTKEIPLATHDFGRTHPYTLHGQRVLARAFADEGCFVEAESLAGATLEARLRQSSDLEGNGRT